MITCVLPTRGMVFTQVIEAFEEIKKRWSLRILMSHDLPIPDAHNFLTERALSYANTEYIFYVEEDTVPPTYGIDRMLALDSDIAFIDYGVNGWSCSAIDKITNEILWCGVGCTLVKRKVFEALEKPWFRTDKTLRLNDWKWLDNPAKYGGHDIWFCMQARSKGFKIKRANGECKHLQLNELGKKEWNNGLHNISEKPKIEKQQNIEGGGDYFGNLASI